MPAKLLDTIGFLRFVLRRWNEDRCPQIAGSLTYTSLLAITPVFAIAVALLASTPFFGAVMTKIRVFLLLNLAPEIARTIITEYMPEFARSARRLTWVGAATVLVVAVWMMLIMDRSLNTIWRVRRARPLWMSAAMYMAVIVAWPVLLGVSVTITTYIMALSREITGLSGRVHWILLRGIPVATSALAFFLLYRIIPHGRVPWRHAALGGLAHVQPHVRRVRGDSALPRVDLPVVARGALRRGAHRRGIVLARRDVEALARPRHPVSRRVRAHPGPPRAGKGHARQPARAHRLARGGDRGDARADGRGRRGRARERPVVRAHPRDAGFFRVFSAEPRSIPSSSRTS